MHTTSRLAMSRQTTSKLTILTLTRQVSEASCEICTHTADTAEKNLSKGHYIHRDIGGVWTTPEMSGSVLHYG